MVITMFVAFDAEGDYAVGSSEIQAIANYAESWDIETCVRVVKLMLTITDSVITVLAGTVPVSACEGIVQLKLQPA